MLGVRNRSGPHISFAPFFILAMVLAACAPRQSTPSPTATATQVPATATLTPSPSPSPTPREFTESMATLQAQLTPDPCSAGEVLSYSEQVLPLAEEHLQAANLAHSLQPWREGQQGFDKGYEGAVERLRDLERVIPPPCAEKAHLKFTSALRLLIDVWDHLGEGEFDIAQRKLLASFEEVSQATALLTQLQSNTNQLP